ncbi:MAG: tRNA pseudouridine(13) synthase TruD, partial [Myxococcota bacterium]
MSYKIKVKEDDFIVKEKYSIDISDRGKYSVFLLYKRGWNTDELVKKISNDTGIDVNLFSYGGRKDRHSVSEQIITIRGNYKNL